MSEDKRTAFKSIEPEWEFLFQCGHAFCAADAGLVIRVYYDKLTETYYEADINGYDPKEITRERMEYLKQRS